MFLSLQGVSKRFGSLVAVDGVDLEIAEGELVLFLGPSGCGKTTLLRLIAGLGDPDGGRLLLNGEDLAHVPARARNFGMVFQSYSLFPHMSVARNVAYGLECHGWPAVRRAQRVEELLSMMRLAELAERLPSQLSGGQQQRVALARALAANPVVLLLDEPLSALDAKVRAQLRSEVRDLQRKLGITTVMVTHDQTEAMQMADRILVMNRGRIEQVGTAAELYYRPANRFVAEFLGQMNLLRRDGPGVPGIAPAGELLAIRPETVQVLPAGTAGPDCYAATVRQTVFMGNLTCVELEMSGQPLTAEVAFRAAEGLEPGQPVSVRLPADALVVLPEA
jgi:iron(III) transport system ATP-binding protein